MMQVSSFIQLYVVLVNVLFVKKLQLN